MSEEDKVKLYIQRLEVLALEKVNVKKVSAITALKEALHIIEGEMVGY